MAKSTDPLRCFDSSPEVIRLVVMMYVRYPLSLRNVEDLLFERGIDICHETVRLWWNRFGPMFAAEIRRKRVHHMRAYTHWRWHLDEVYVRINAEMRYVHLRQFQWRGCRDATIIEMRHAPIERIRSCLKTSWRPHPPCRCARRTFRDGTTREVRGLAGRKSRQVSPKTLGLFLIRRMPGSLTRTGQALPTLMFPPFACRQSDLARTRHA